MSNYVKGRTYEYATVRKLLKQGAVDARRTAGSHGPYDVIGIFPDHIELIQVKSGVSPDDGKLAQLPVPPNVTKWLYVYQNRTCCVTSIP
jgi:hypothetical protein